MAIKFTGFTQTIKRVETVSGAIYQFTHNRYADATERTLMVRLPGFDGSTFGSLNEPVVVKEIDPHAVGLTLHVVYEDPWEGGNRDIISSTITRINEWIVN